MVTITVKMNVHPTKRKELLQTLDELKEVKRKKKGFIDAHVCMKNGNENTVTLIEEWETKEDVDAYMQSEYFYILRGAMKLLTSVSEIEFSNV
jgi:quinol monooxygenase YgiN